MKTKSKYSIKKELQNVENMKKYPVKFRETKKDRYQINLHRLNISDTVFFPTWLQEIYLEFNLDPCRYVKRKVFRIENQNIYKLCLSHHTKNSSEYGVAVIINLSENIVYVERRESCGYHYNKIIMIDQKDSASLLKNLLNALAEHLIDCNME